MNIILYTLFLSLASIADAKVVPIEINQDQIEDVSKKFAGLFSLNSSNSPQAVGEDFEFEVTIIYQNLELNKIDFIGDVSSKELLEPIVTIRKGLYLNLDIAFSFVLPVESQFISGYSFNLSHSSKVGTFFIKPDLYISNYNINDILNINSSGVNLIAFKKISFLYFGLGGRLEFVKGVYEVKSLGNNTITTNNETKSDFISTAAVAKIVFDSSRTRLSLTYSAADQDKSEAALSLSFKF